MNPRVAEYRDQARPRGLASHTSPREENLSKAFFELYAELPLAERQARSLAYVIEHEPVYIFPLERIVGMTYQACRGADAVELYESKTDPRWTDWSVLGQAKKEAAKIFPPSEPYHRQFGCLGAPGHVEWDFGLMLELGVEGMLAKIERLRAEKSDDPKEVEFYDGATILLNGFLAWVGKHVEALRGAAAVENDPGRRRELLEMAEICERVPAKPARNFREAVQSFYLQHLAVMLENPFGGNGPGRVDWYLWPYLEADLKAGRTTLDEARDLMTETLIKLDERIHRADGWVEAIVVGGRNPDGSISINPLSYMIVEAMFDLNNTHPGVYMRVPDGAPSDFVDLAVKYVIHAGNRAQIYGDDAVINALVKDGFALEDARHWAAGGCMEVGVQGASGDMLFSFAHNILRALELVLNGGKRLKYDGKISPVETTLADYGSYEELYEAFAAELARETSILTRQLDIGLECFAKYRPSFLLSTMVRDCLERGRAINDGGARYPNYGGSGLGIPNVGDSLYAIKKAVFEERKYTGAEILEALRADFVGYDDMRAYLMNLPKYGSGRDKEVVEIVDRVLMEYTGLLKGHVNPRGGHCRLVVLGFTWVVDLGLETGATPDGRLSGKPLAHGLAPQCGSAVNGITAAIEDATSLSLSEVDGGASMMWDISHMWAKPEFVRPVLETYIAEGGHIFQGNVSSVEQLIEAQEHPDEHRDLMVRVGGYSGRFVTLSKEIQDEVISRHKYGG